MPTLPEEVIPLLLAFAPQFSKRVFDHVSVLVMGVLLTPGARTVCAALRVMGVSGERQFQTFPRAWNRDRGSGRKIVQALLGFPVRTLGLRDRS